MLLLLLPSGCGAAVTAVVDDNDCDDDDCVDVAVWKVQLPFAIRVSCRQEIIVDINTDDSVVLRY